MTHKNTVVPLTMNDATLRRRIAELSLDSSKVFLAVHAKVRMEERGISSRQIFECLKRGHMTDHAWQEERGGWRCTLRHRSAGDMVAVGVSLRRRESGDYIAVITVFP